MFKSSVSQKELPINCIPIGSPSLENPEGIEMAGSPDKFTGMQVKVKRMSGNVFVVKTRLHPDYSQPTKEKKKRGKNSRRNRKNSNQGKTDTP